MHGVAMEIDVTPIHITVTGEPFMMTATRIKAMDWKDAIQLYSVSPVLLIMPNL